MMPGEIHLVIRGSYGEITVLAAVETAEAAQAWADRWNLDHMPIRTDDAFAVVGDRVPYIAAGAR